MKNQTFWSIYTLCVIGLLTALLLLTGCAARPNKAVINEEQVFTVQVVEEFSRPMEENTAGITISAGPIHRIEILRDYYPECLAHEIRHVIEGSWHQGKRVDCR